MRITFRDTTGIDTEHVVAETDEIVFVDAYENGSFERYGMFYVYGEIRKVNMRDILSIEKSVIKPLKN